MALVGAAALALLGLGGVHAPPVIASTVTPPAPAPAGPPDKAAAAEALGNLPLRFEANVGQTDSQAAFVARTGGGTVFLTGTEAVMTVPAPAKSDITPPGAADVVRMRPLGANPTVRPVGVDPLPGVSNYLTGNDPVGWNTNVPAFGSVRYPAVYPGIDLVFHGKQKALEYDYEVAPGADPAAITIGIDTPGPMTLEANGDLVVHNPNGPVRQSKPILYQDIDGARRHVDGAFALRGGKQVGFEIGAYDPSRPLVIDPIVQFTAFLGGSGGDTAAGLALDSAGNIYVSGTAASLDFPTHGTQISPPGVGNAFVAKLNPTGSALVYSTYLGPYTAAGGWTGRARGGPVAVDSTGSAVITGVTDVPNFPTTPNAFDLVCGSGTDELGNPDPSCNSYEKFTDGNMTAGSNVLTIVFRNRFQARHVGSAIYSPNLPTGTTITAVSNQGRTITLSNPATTTGTGVTYTIDAGVTKPDAFVSKLSPGGDALVYSSYLGGSQGGLNDFEEAGTGIAVDTEGIYVTGATRSGDFPTTANAFSPSCARSTVDVAPTPSVRCNYTRPSTFNDGTIAIDFSGLPDQGMISASAGFNSEDVNKFITGPGILAETRITSVSGNRASLSARPTESGSNREFTIVERVPAAHSDAFLVRVDPRLSGAASLAYSTYLGGKASDRANGVATDPSSPGSVYVVGRTRSSDFPVSATAFERHCDGIGPTQDCVSQGAFVAKLDTKADGAISFNWGSFLGRTLDDDGRDVTADASGVYVAGSTASFGFPLLNPFQGVLSGSTDGFVTKLTTDGSALLYSTYLGGPGNDAASSIAVDPTGSAHVAGSSDTGFPQAGGIVQTRTDGQYAAKLIPTGAALHYSAIVAPPSFSSPLTATDSAGSTYVAGTVAGPFGFAPDSFGAPTRSGDDAYVLKLSAGVMLAVTGLTPPGGPVYGGTPVVITGTAFSGATNVFFGDLPATSFTVDSDTQITAISPPKPASTPFTPVPVTVSSPQGTSWATPEVRFTFGMGTPTGYCADSSCPTRGALITLKTGEVLLTNGVSSQLYSPGTGTWRPTASCEGCGLVPTSANPDEMAVLLPDGKVLWTGGSTIADFQVSTAGSFLYDPATETWSPTKTPAGNVTTMTEPRAWHTTTLLANGKVLVAGGLISSGSTTIASKSTAELYDPAAGTWTPTGTLTVPRGLHSAVLLDPATGNCGSNCGKVLAAFGRRPLSESETSTVEATNTLELYGGIL